jgi:hypothetical protein
LTPEAPPIEWLQLLLMGAAAVIMVFLVRRMMRGMNQQDFILLRQARSRGLDVSRPQPVEFVVFAATEQAAADVAERMRAEGYETSIKQAAIQYARNRSKPGAPQEGWLVGGRRVVQLAPETLTEARRKLNEIAAEHKAAYLGWQIGSVEANATPTAPTR